jgi:queuosine precursor transporter
LPILHFDCHTRHLIFWILIFHTHRIHGYQKQICRSGVYCNVSANVPPKPALTSRETASSTPTAAAISRVAVVVVAAYIGAQMLADIASLKIGIVAGLAVDMGTFIYPITFTLRDVVHKTLGKQLTRTLIVTAAVINLFMALYLMWSASVPSDPGWGLGAQFSAILAPVWRIVTASIVAEVVSELLDTEVYHWWVTRVTRRYQWLRVLLSNSISVPVDNLIFALGAFGGVLPWEVVWQIFIFNLLVKYGVTVLSLPLIYIAPDRNASPDR